ncbi:hypothetical protein [Vibrio salinus]|uniref:hypothetical protein n=1 Tax=Vibrio salinus TaxID=2899784 RepID=UPI001E29B070|nr:hypothetical protein [Vibrio salinus]MCE0495353.1 hypothetical protein [Vibrio salinus]
MKKRFLLLLCASSLFGCANMHKLDSKNQGKHIELARDLTRARSTGVAGIKGLFPITWIEGVFSGEYVAEGQDAEGIYYWNTKCCIAMEKRGKMFASMHGWDCGIWVPNDKNDIVRTYYHDNESPFSYIGWFVDFTYQQFELSLKQAPTE